MEKEVFLLFYKYICNLGILDAIITLARSRKERYIGGTKEKEDDDDDSFPRVARHGRYLLPAMDGGGV